MRNMSNIPKLPAHTERSSCCSVKVGAHNKEECERTLTSQWPSCPATLRSLHTASAGGFLPETRAIPRQNSVVWQKKQTQKCEFGTKSTRGGKRTEAWRRKHAHTQKFCGSSENSAHNAELFCGGRNAAKSLYFKNYSLVQELYILKKKKRNQSHT